MSSKYLLLAAELRRLCVQLRQEGRAKLPGELELSRDTGYSRQTVRHALGILEQEGTVVRLHGSGTYLSESRHPKNTRVAVLLTDPDHYLYPQLVRDIESVCGPAGYTAEVYATGNRVSRERELLRSLLEHLPAGILMEPAASALPSPNLDLLAQIGRKRIPFVWLHASLPVPEEAPCFQDDNAGGASALVRHLLERGHRQIAGIFKSDDRQGQERYFGFVSELIRRNAPVPESCICWYDTSGREAMLDGKAEWMERFVRERAGVCSAAVCYNDETAYALVRCLKKNGRSVPGDLAVVSFDNSHLCSLSPVPLTSLAHERHRLGSSAAEALLRLMQGRKVSGARLPWVLRERTSG